MKGINYMVENKQYPIEEEKIVKILYTNYRNETKIRTIIPSKLWYGSTKWHPENQWLLNAYDVDKQADRSFAMKDVKAWFI